MPQTLKHTIDRAAAKAKIKEAGIDLTDQDYTDFTSELNALMFELGASGVRLGWVETTDLTANISTPMWADLYVQNYLALHMIAEYGIPTPPELLAAFDRSERVIENNLVGTPKARYPNILPQGGFHRHDGCHNHFFADETDDSLMDNLGSPLGTDTGEIIYE